MAETVFSGVFRVKERINIAIDILKFLKDGTKTRSEMRAEMKSLALKHKKSESTVQIVVRKLKQKGFLKTARNSYKVDTSYIQSINKEWSELLVS